MADNVSITPGSGATISADDLGGVLVQRVKIQIGADGSATDVTSSNPIPVSDAGTTLSVDDAGTTLSVDDGGGSLTVDGSVSLAAAIPAGTNAIGIVGLAPQTAGGWSVSRLLAAASTNATSVKASAGQVGGWYLFNAATATRYLKLYNKASAPTVGTDTPFMTIPIPPGAAANVELAQGIALGTGIAFALTTGVADSDTGALTANDVVVNLLYK